VATVEALDELGGFLTSDPAAVDAGADARAGTRG
jgi:hypothetical protein